MNDLIKRAFEVRDALRYCVGSNMGSDCEKCIYYKYDGCVNWLMLDAAKVIERMIEVGGYIDALQIVNAPTVDAVEVVRCLECKHHRDKNEQEKKYLVEDVLICTSPDATDDCWNAVWPDHFCSYGERKVGDRNG